VTEFDKLVELAKKKNVNLVVPGPELPLIEGIEERFRKAGIRCFGPTLRAARMEGSKAFSKEFLLRHNIPTARSEVHLNTMETLTTDIFSV
jgi:phosphoribosylamine--glycine ligase / phosphoribosylformylglycinamidine cyclo-ligase